MSELKPYICTGCGGHIDPVTLVCKSCGTAYRLDDEMRPVKLITSHLKFVTIGSSVMMPREIVIGNKDEAMKYTLNEMAREMAQKILPLIEYQTEYDMAHQMYVTRGRVRVADPHQY